MQFIVKGNVSIYIYTKQTLFCKNFTTTNRRLDAIYLNSKCNWFKKSFGVNESVNRMSSKVMKQKNMSQKKVKKN